MIDTRFPPQPEQVSVPLYPTKEMVLPEAPATSEALLSAALQEAFSCEPNQLIVGDSASSLLRVYLSQISETGDQLRVGIPAYCCQSVIDAVIDNDAVPVFYDVNDDTSLAAEATEFLAEEKCQTCVWPVYFGSRERDQQLVDRLHDAGISIVYDEAQANPFSDTSAHIRRTLDHGDVAIYSFGVSKMLAGKGGGALYAHHVSDEVEAVRQIVLAEPKEISSQEPRIAPKHYTDLDRLLEERGHEGSPNVRINPYSAGFALNQVEQYHYSRDNHDAAYEELSSLLTRSFGGKILDFIDGVEGTPTIVALKIPAEKRYDFMADMAIRSVQTTWYYYPMNRISRYAGYRVQQDVGSSAIAESVVILPFQWAHTDIHHDQLSEALIATAGGIK